jgi:hypothetical protein
MMNNTNTQEMKMKIEVAGAASGLGGLTDAELVARLEGLYWKGFADAVVQVRAGMQVGSEDAPHPDSARLDHIIACDHSVVSPLEDGNPNAGTIESIHFIFENPFGLHGRVSNSAHVRDAIDRSIANRAARNLLAAVRGIS